MHKFLCAINPLDDLQVHFITSSFYKQQAANNCLTFLANIVMTLLTTQHNTTQ